MWIPSSGSFRGCRYILYSGVRAGTVLQAKEPEEFLVDTI